MAVLDYGAASKPRRVSLNLSQKFILGFLLLSLLLSGGVCLVGYQSIQAKYMDFYYRIALSAAQTAADLIEAETAERYLSSLTEDEDYAGAFHAMDVVKEYTGMQYLYLFYPSEEGYLYIYDARVEGEDPQDLCALGQIDAYPGTNDHLMRAFETGQPVEDILVSDSELGYVGTVFAPVLDAGGRSVALMGADVSMHEVQEELRAFLLKSLGLSVGTVFVLVFLYLVYLKRRVVDQIGKLTQSVNAYAQDSGNLVYSDAQIHTGDEIEQLSNAFTHMAGQVESYMRNLEKVTAEKQRIGHRAGRGHQYSDERAAPPLPAFPGERRFRHLRIHPPGQRGRGRFLRLLPAGPGPSAVHGVGCVRQGRAGGAVHDDRQGVA